MTQDAVELEYENRSLYPQLQRATAGAAGLDLCAERDTMLRGVLKGVTKVPTGVRVAIPPGYVGLLFIRSSLALAGLRLQNGTGVIDSDYRGDITALVCNDNGYAIWLTAGHRFAQLVVVPVLQVTPILTKALPGTERGEGGFGSTDGDKQPALGNN